MAQSAHELLQHADVAMYAAKRGPTSFVVYSAEYDTNSVRQLTLTGQLRRAIEDDQMLLEFQPKIDARSGRLAGVEALVRWQHPEFGPIPPGEFIHSAEQTGLIKPLTLWVMNAALRELRRWTALRSRLRRGGQSLGQVAAGPGAARTSSGGCWRRRGSAPSGSPSRSPRAR